MVSTDVVPVAVTLIAGAYRRPGWRGTLVDGGVTVWRCTCDRPHLTRRAADDCGLAELRARLGRQGMRIWTATYRPQQQFTEAEIVEMSEARELALIETQIRLPSWASPESLPQTADEAVDALAALEDVAISSRTWQEVRHYKRTIEVIQVLYKEEQRVRFRSQKALMCCDWRIGVELLADEDNEATGGWPSRGDAASLQDRPPTLAEKVGDRKFAWRAKQIGELSIDAVRDICDRLHASKKDAVLTVLVDLKRGAETRERRAASLNAEPLPDGMEYRVGDCRVAMNDIEDDSVAAIITDPPYGREAEPLYHWLAEFAERVLVPGGSLICFTGTGMVNRDYRIFDAREGLTYWWTPILFHGDAHKMFHAGVRANHKPILWYVKGSNRRAVHGERITIVPDVVNNRAEIDEGNISVKDKSDHQWSQGTGGVPIWIHHLSRPAELIVDPFAGSGTWGRIAADMGRRWIGCDVVEGGNEEAIVDDLDEAAD